MSHIYTIFRPSYFVADGKELIKVEEGRFCYEERWNGARHSFGVWFKRGSNIQDFIAPIREWIKIQNIQNVRDSVQARQSLLLEAGTWFQWDFSDKKDAMLFKLRWVNV